MNGKLVTDSPRRGKQMLQSKRKAWYISDLCVQILDKMKEEIISHWHFDDFKDLQRQHL